MKKKENISNQELSKRLAEIEEKANQEKLIAKKVLDELEKIERRKRK